MLSEYAKYVRTKEMFIDFPPDAILTSVNDEDAVLFIETVLKKVLSIDKFTIQKINGGRFFHVLSGSEEELLTIDCDTNKIEGPLGGAFLRAVRLISAIENELTTSLLYPPEMRKTAIESVCSRNGVSQQEFTEVLRHWS
jgi:hypothetical protein